MAIALVRATTAFAGAGTTRSVAFLTPVPSGRLLLVYAWSDLDTGVVPAAPDGTWTTVFTQVPYEGNKGYGVLFSKISDGGADTGGSDGQVGPFTNSGQVAGSEWSGTTSASAVSVDLGDPENHVTGETFTRSRSVTPGADGLAVMVMQNRTFSTDTNGASGGATVLHNVGDPDSPMCMVYKLGSGSLSIQSSNGAAKWSQSSAAAFGIPPAPGTPGEEVPHEPQAPARALVEIYVPDPDADRWGEALWGTGVWSSAEWVDITYLCVSVDWSWGVSRPDAGILSDVEAGLCTVITYDPDRILDPANESSPYAPHITYGLPIRISHRGKVIRTGYCESISFSYESDFGEIRATDHVAALAAVTVPEDVVLSDTLFARTRDVIAATGVPISVINAPGGDPALAPWEPGSFTAWDVIRHSAREVHYLPFIQFDTRLTFRAWDAPIDRGGVIGSPELIELVPFVSADSLYSVVQVNDATAMTEVERRITPLPRYGERVYRRDLATINGGAWADRVLEDRAQSGLRWRPGAIFPLDADSVEYLSYVLMNEFLTIDYPEASPDVEVRVRVLGERIRVVDLGGQAGPDWRWWFTTTTSYLSPLEADGITPPEYLVDDATGEYLYPDGVVGLE